LSNPYYGSQMQGNTAIAVISATLVAIGAALSVSTCGGRPNRIDSFEMIAYTRNVDHGQLALLGSCPLRREIIIEPTGRTRISWYAQRPDQHGCVRATDDVSLSKEEERLDEPNVADIELMLSPSDLHGLIGRLESLSWKLEWTTIVNGGGTHSPGCKSTTFSIPNRELWVLKSQTQVATLAVDEKLVPDAVPCIAKEKENEAALDSAFASFSPLLPSKYDLRPEVASRLYREE
jgi:hypothetical protein